MDRLSEIRARNAFAIITANGGIIYVDYEDAERLMMYTWHIDSKGYAAAWINGKIERMHRFLLNPGRSYFVDHVNGVRTDNRRANLRIATPSQNSRHRTRALSSTGIIGVREHGEKFIAEIEVNKRKIHLGVFCNANDAEKARIDAESQYFGEFAPIRNEVR